MALKSAGGGEQIYIFTTAKGKFSLMVMEKNRSGMTDKFIEWMEQSQTIPFPYSLY